MEKQAFGTYLTSLRLRAKLTNRQLAELAEVPRSFIAGLQSGRRRVGEYQARKIGVALGLEGPALDAFILRALDTCTKKILNISKDYPAELLNMLALQLRSAGILPTTVHHFQVHGDESKQDVELYLHDGRKAHIATTVAYA